MNSPDSISANSGATNKIKHQMVRDSLAESIRRGDFQVGHRLPADRQLAEQFGVSYMTARRAVGELVEADLLERRIGDGTYVRSHTQERLSETTLNLICSAYGGAQQNDFLNGSAKLIEARNWKHHTIRVHPHREREAVRALQSGERALVLLDDPELEGPLGKALESAHERVVLVGNCMNESRVPSVLADDKKAVQMAIAHLQKAGHKHIALVANHPEGHNESVQVRAWRACFSDLPPYEWNHRLICANTPRFECATHYSYQQLLRWLPGAGDVTALLCLGDELAVGALAACRDLNLEIPGDLSLVNITAGSKMFYVHPPLTCVDVRLEAHMETALKMLDAAAKGALTKRLQLIEPRLVERCSVGAPRSQKRNAPPKMAARRHRTRSLKTALKI